jgi:MtN3 and saliva related transmembrane protein
MNNVEIIGFTAGIFLAISLIPQIIKSWKTRSTKDISLIWNLVNLVGELLWIIYGFGINSYSLIIMSGISFLMNVFMVSLKIKFG